MSLKGVIEGVHVVAMGRANGFLIEGDDGLTLVEAGFPGKEAAVFAALRELGRSPDQLKHLILTHGHSDHFGSAAAGFGHGKTIDRNAMTRLRKWTNKASF